MITFHVSKAEYTEFMNTGRMTIVRGADRSWTDRFNSELETSFTTAKRKRDVVLLSGRTCQVKLQNINEVITATIDSISLDLDHLGKWKFMVNLTCSSVLGNKAQPEIKSEPKPEIAQTPSTEPVKETVVEEKPAEAPSSAPDGRQILYALIAVIALLAVLIGINFLR